MVSKPHTSGSPVTHASCTYTNKNLSWFVYRSIRVTILLHKLPWLEYPKASTLLDSGTSANSLQILDRVMLLSSDSPLEKYSHRLEYSVSRCRETSVEFSRECDVTFGLYCTYKTKMNNRFKRSSVTNGQN